MRSLMIVWASTVLLLAPVRSIAMSGDPDPTFGSGGVVVTDFGGPSAPSAVARQADGKLVVAGAAAASAGAPTAIAVARYDASGALDPTFGSGGMVKTKVGTRDDQAARVLLQPDGAIVVVGRTATVADGTNADIVLVRYLTDGTLDASFGSGGIVVDPLTSEANGAQSGALQADGMIVVVGGNTSTAATTTDIFVRRYDTNGALDPGFGVGGVVTLDFGGRADNGRDVVIQPDGKIVVAGASFNGPLFLDGSVATLTRLETAGAVDGTFGTGGSTILKVDTVNVFQALAQQSDGRLLAFGATGPGAVAFRPFRYDADGNADGTYGGSIGAFDTIVTPGALALAPDGKSVTLGDAFTVMRRNLDGSSDATFGSGGHTSLPVLGAYYAVATVVEPSGNIVVAGTANLPPTAYGSFGLVRILGASATCASDVDCDVCESCVGSTCTAAPRTGCAPANAGKAGLLVVEKGPTTSVVKFGWAGTVPTLDPTTSDDVGMCLYQAGGRILKLVAPAAGTCAGKPCWRGALATGIRYADREQTPDGIRTIAIKPTKITLKAKGIHLTTSRHGVPHWYLLGPQSAPVVAQIHASNGSCLEATFSTRRAIRPSQLSAKSD